MIQPLWKFVTRKWIRINDLSSGQYFVKNTRFKSPMVRSGLCDYSKAYIVVKGAITVAGTNVNNGIYKVLVFNNNTPFRSCISKINEA